MAYTPNPYNTLQPTDDVFAGTAAAEFRAMKVALLGIGSGASYRGEWATFVAGAGPHPASQGDTFTHNNAMWMLKVAVADVEVVSPLESDTATWFKLYPSSLVVNSVNGGQLAGMRNKILNGRMEVNQIPVAAVAAGASAYTLDQWITNNGTAGALAAARVADGPSSEFAYSHRLTVTTADATIAAGDFVWHGQPLEGWDICDLVGRTFTYSFWVKSSKVGTYTLAFKNAALTRTYLTEITVLAANTWEFKQVTVVGGLPTTGVWDYESGLGLYVMLTLAGGSTYQEAPNAWKIGSFLATSSQVNFMDTIGAAIHTTGCQLEIGDQATQFEHRPRSIEEWLVQRYALLGVARIQGTTTNTHQYKEVVRFGRNMRAAPIITIGASVSAGFSGPGTSLENEPSQFSFIVAATASGGSFINTDWTALARLV